MNDTWECIVWDGARWVRFPDCVFDSAALALDAASKIRSYAVSVVLTSTLNSKGLPTEPPSARGWWRLW